MNIFTHKYYQTNFLNKRENNILTNLLILYIKREVTQKKRERSCKVLRNNYSCFYFVYILLILNRYCINISCINLVLNLNYFLLFFFFFNLIISYLNYKKKLCSCFDPLKHKILAFGPQNFMRASFFQNGKCVEFSKFC